MMDYLANMPKLLNFSAITAQMTLKVKVNEPYHIFKRLPLRFMLDANLLFQVWGVICQESLLQMDRQTDVGNNNTPLTKYGKG